MDSVSKQQYPHPDLLVCPYARFASDEDEFRFVHFGESPILSASSVQESSYSSHISHHPLDRCNKKEGQHINFKLCAVCGDPLIGTTYYSCVSCVGGVNVFHKECIEPISKHSYHLKHSLRLQYNYQFAERRHFCCSSYTFWLYTCSTCDFIICRDCARKPPVLAINHPQKHEHTLFYFYRKESLTCDVCSLSDYCRSLFYSCHQCGFVVHRDCVYLPCIIRISRHGHRLSFNSSLTRERCLCGVCRVKIDTNYGRYSCVKGCIYAVHSKCATRYDVWDEKELEGTPEEEEEEDASEEDIKSFDVINDGIIQHFSHQNHHMRLDEETGREFDESKRCQACTLTISDDYIVYNCIQCDFILHQACAHLPRRKQHVMHPHRLTLQVRSQRWCCACNRKSVGFMYACLAMGCSFMLDVCCAYVSEPFDHRCHPHSLFLTSKPNLEQTCSICQRLQYTCLNCGECSFVLCFGCATLPYKLRYKKDEHFLVLSYDKDANGQYWCDVCEEEADPKTNGVYMCNDCNVTLHIKCLLGEEDKYMMPGGILTVGMTSRYVIILPNNHLTRNICNSCHNRCQTSRVYKMSESEIFCSLDCLGDY